MRGRAAAWAVLTILLAVMAFGAVQSPDDEGKKTLETSCSGCHDSGDVVKDEGLSKDEWRKLIQRMVQNGADLKEDQINVLSTYLATNYGQGRKILDTACTTCHGLDEVKKFSGFFKKDDWQDIVSTMVKYGANVKEAQVSVLVDYLTAAYSVKR